jgi:hypothetical protein
MPVPGTLAADIGFVSWSLVPQTSLFPLPGYPALGAVLTQPRNMASGLWASVSSAVHKGRVEQEDYMIQPSAGWDHRDTDASLLPPLPFLLILSRAKRDQVAP